MLNSVVDRIELMRIGVAGILRRLLPYLLFLGIFAAVVATIDDYGLTVDEVDYVESAKRIEYWFSHATDSSRYFTYEFFVEYWKTPMMESILVGNVHPPFYKLSGILWEHLAGRMIFDIQLFQYRISTAFWTSVLVVTIFLVVRRFTGKSSWALVGGLTFITVPAFFAHAHFFTTDMMVTALGFAGLSMFMFAPRFWQRVFLGGALMGAALATKFTGLVALGLTASMILVADDRRRFAREYGYMLCTAFCFFCLLNVPLLFNPRKELHFYFSSFFDREKRLPIPTLYFGRVYDFRLPFLQPLVMFGIILPPLVVITTVIGLCEGITRYVRSRDAAAYFAVVPFLLCMGIFLLPSTPKHDGIRLFSTVWPFIAILSVQGCRSMRIAASNKIDTGMIVAVLCIMFSAVALVNNHPYQLNYYNMFIGGTKGAQDRGFSVSYWHESMNRDFFRRVAQAIGTGEAAVYAHNSDNIIIGNQMYGISPTSLRPVEDTDAYEYILVLNRILTQESLDYLKECRPIVEIKTRDGALVGGMYLNR